MVEPSSKLKSLRALMAEHNVQAYVVPHSDPHMTEYVPVSDEWIAFVSGFNGSNGLCVVTQNEALCWTDSRYFLQCEKQLEAGWEMRKMLKGEPTWFEWVSSNLKSGECCGYDPLLITIDTVDTRGNFLKGKGVEFKPLKENLVAKVWADRPPVPQSKLYILEDSYAGESAKQKLHNIGKELKGTGATNYLVTDLCEIAWTLNLRAKDAECTPLFISYLYLSYDFNGDSCSHTGTLFVHEEKVSEEVRSYLKGINIEVKPYDSVQGAVADVQTKTYINRTGCNAALYQAFKHQDSLIGKNRSIIEHLKGIKNPREIQGFRDCHIRDGAAVVRYFAWLDHALNVEGRTDLNEYSAALRLDELRYEQKLNKGLSFPAISSIGSNGAIVHYRADEKTAATLNNKEVYLLDSGGQYLDGTTDTTRTTHFGKATDEEKDAYTRVLLGNLDVERVLFPNNGTYSGADLDVLARRHLWAKGLDYGHGTGHGVGYFLNVHEGPIGISKYRSEPFLEGHVMSNEPGYYKTGGFGIRIENVLVVEKRLDGKFLGFENFTRVPYERELIDVSLLSKCDLDHINQYHETVYKDLLPILEEQGDKIAIEYLKKKTAKLTL